jgi:hypothetical protein
VVLGQMTDALTHVLRGARTVMPDR